MAGFFGLFDYNKPGPGVSKNAPKKKGFIVFFEIYFRKFWKLITANLLYVLVTLPLVTVGLSNAGLTYITRNFAREKHAFIAGDFFDTIKKNWKQALPAGIINLVVTFILAFDIYFFMTYSLNADSQILHYILLAVTLSIALFFTFMKYYIFMIMITFKLKLKQIYKNSAILAIAGLKRNLLIFVVLGLLYIAAIALAFINLIVGITVILFVYILLFPAFRSYLIQYNIFPVIKKFMIDPYYKEHPGEDLEAKRALNIADEEDAPADGEEPVFQDVVPGADEEDEKKPANTFPRQYTQQEMERLRRKQRRNKDYDDDDGTI